MERAGQFELAADRIEQAAIPKYTLNNNTVMPCIGYGTFGSDHVTPKDVAESVKTAVSLGYRQLDCARAYGNEKEIGAAINEILASRLIKREELHITSKIWNDRHKEGEVLISCAETLRDLKLNYLDLYLIHWPFPNHHGPGCDDNERDPNAKPFNADRYLMVWHQMERLVDLGLVKSIGVSNMTIPKLDSVWPHMRIKPAVNEVELHPHLQQTGLLAYMKEKNILAIAHTPLGSPNRPDRDRTDDDTNILDDPAISKIAKAHNIHPVTVCIKWAVQRGTLPVPFSTSRSHMLSNLRCCTEYPLADTEMNDINSITTTNRFIKGTVLLWEGAPSWRCLWDLNGEIDTGGWRE
ncbi:MAG: aldo/keto reductase [Spirochaetaceae bacterium]|jgi:alcohol dehydrogenase (NADP+)|nr:aldo/keto reductase [Spirochaetaceae bacterium]